MFFTALKLLFNFGNIMKVVKQYWKELAVIGMIGLLAYQNLSPTRFLFFLETIPSLEHRLSVSQSNLDICAKGNETLTESINTRNDEVAQWKALSEKLQKKNKEVAAKIAENQKKSKEKIKEILSQPTPKTCSDAMDLLRKDRENIKWKK